MIARYVDQLIEKLPAAQDRGKNLANTIHGWVLLGGKPARWVADMLHGTWLGHPLHPVLTDIVIGSWSLAALFDLISRNKRSYRAERTADKLTEIGTIAAVPTAITGLADYSTIPQPAAGTALVHALTMDFSLGLYLLSLWARKKGERDQGFFWSMLGLAVLVIGSYLGGHLVYRQKVGVDHGEARSEPDEWTDLIQESDLAEGEPKEVEIAGQPVLLYRHNYKVYAVGNICPHAGAPLADGDFSDDQVQCPWHDSVFRLRDGHNVHGPSTYPVPAYETRIYNGQIQVRVLNAS